jgi:hypothetical protein
MNSSDVQYFDSDFSFEEHARDCIALAQQQQQQQLDKSSSPCHPSSSLLYCGTDNSADIVASSTSSKFEGYNGNFGADDDNDKLQPQSQANFWNAFHTNHSAGNFYKPRRYLTKSFPCIMRYLLDETPHRSDDNHSESYQEVDQRSTKGDDKIILEIGSGSGSSCIPIIKQYSEIMLMKQQQCRNDGDKVVLDQYCNILLACDSSLVAVETTRRAINSISQSSFLFDAFVADPSLTGNDGNNDNEEESNNTSLFVREITMACATMLSSNRRSDTHCDQIELSNTSFGGGITVMHDGEGIVGIVLLVFVLSAVTPSRVEHFMRNVFLVTRPGGKVCFRDYGRE